MFFLLSNRDTNAIKKEISLSDFNSLQDNSVLNKSGVVRLRNSNGVCSGFVVSNKYVLTAAHCVDGVHDDIIVSSEDRKYKVIAKSIAYDNVRDVALLKGDFRQFKRLAFDARGELLYEQSGRNIISCGYPLDGNALVCVKLVITGSVGYKIFASGGLIIPGMSGGPVVDMTSGVVIGINSAVSNGVLFAPVVAIYEGFML
jgi:S1-C subfamily serine protease